MEFEIQRVNKLLFSETVNLSYKATNWHSRNRQIGIFGINKSTFSESTNQHFELASLSYKEVANRHFELTCLSYKEVANRQSELASLSYKEVTN